MISSLEQRPTFQDAALHREIMRLREVDNHTNLFFLAVEYLSLATVMAGAIVFAEYRDSWGLPWLWNVPVFAIAIILIGGIQHRLAGLGHESSHYSFMKNRVLNDLIPDLFCMFPLFTTIHFYRLFHMGHHQFTNDPAVDPDLQNLGHGKRAEEFPMGRKRFITVIYFCFLVAPIRFLKYQWAYFTVNTLGKGKNVYMERAGGSWKNLRLSAAAGDGVGDTLCHCPEPGFEILDRCRLPAMAGSRRACRDRRARDRHPRPSRLGDLSVAVPPGLFTTGRRLVADGLLHGRAGRAGSSPMGHRRQVGDLPCLALGRAAPDIVYVLHVLARRLPALQRRRWPADQLPGLFRRPVHSLGRLRVRAGHAHPASPFPGGSPLPATPPA